MDIQDAQREVGMRMFLFLAGILIAAGYVIAQYFSGTFSPGAWVTGLALFVFAWIGRSIARSFRAFRRGC